MINFNKTKFVKLGMVSLDEVKWLILPLMSKGETISASFKGLRGFVIFSNKRIIAINVKGFTGKKIDFTSLSYENIIAYSVETAGTFDLDGELELWFSHISKVKFSFNRGVDVASISRIISRHTLMD